MPAYPNANFQSNTHQIQVTSVAIGASLVKGTTINKRVTTYKLVEQTIVMNVNLQKQLLLEYKHTSKNKSQEYSKFLRDIKYLITILFGQCDEETQTGIALGDNYTDDRDEGRLLVLIERLSAIYLGDNNGGREKVCVTTARGAHVWQVEHYQGKYRYVKYTVRI